MTFEEALAELGIEDDAGPDLARRAYLRLLKTRKPETDPQGFMRLREAYEQVKARLVWRDTFLRAHAVEEAREPEAAPIPESADEEPVAEEPVTEEQQHEAKAPEPAVEEPRDEEQQHEEQQHEEPAPDLEKAEALLVMGLPEQAAHELARLFDQAAERSHDAAPAVSKALRLMLMLYAKSSATAAAALGASLFQYLCASGDEARAIRSVDAARWTILRELAALSPSFPDAVRAAVAGAAMAGDLGEARPELAALQRRRPGPAAEAALLLRRRAPVIAAAVADTLDPPAPPSPRAVSTTAGRWGWAFGAVAIGLVRLLMMFARPSSSPSRYEPSRYTPPSYDPAAISALLDGGLGSPPGQTRLKELRERALHRADRMKAHADYALGSDGGHGPLNYEAVSENADLVSSAIRRGDCLAARTRVQAIEAPFGIDGGTSVDENGRVEAWTLDQALTAYCKALDESHIGGATHP